MSEFKQKYSEFINHIELENIMLVEINCKRPLELFDKPSPLAAEVKKPNFKIVKNDEKTLVATATFRVLIKPDNESSKDHPEEHASLLASFALKYRKSRSIETSEEIIHKFLNTNVPLNCWPYGREIISSMTTRMGLPPLVIRTFKVL